MQPTELTPAELGNRETVRENSIKVEDVVRISIDKIFVRDGFNVRKDYGDIKSLAASIAENGQSIPVRVDVLADGTFVLTDGHRRYRALKLLAESTEEDVFIRAIVNSRKTTEEERIIQMFTTQDNKPLAPVEVAEVIQRLVNFGHDKKSIAKKIGRSVQYVENMFVFAGESPVIKEHVANGSMKVSAAMALRKSTPNTTDRIAKANAAVASGNGKTKNVSKELKRDAINPKAKKIAKAILDDEKPQTLERLTEIINQYL